MPAAVNGLEGLGQGLVWCPWAQGIDHHIDAFTMWFAGGGVKGGFVYGSTDKDGREVTDKQVTVPDFVSTIGYAISEPSLYALGIDGSPGIALPMGAFCARASLAARKPPINPPDLRRV